MDYMQIANSPILFILCALVVLIVFSQAALFVYKGYQRGKEIGMQEKVLKKTMTNAAMLTVVPSLPIIVMMLTLSVPLGKYFPWLRLSVVGSAVYEGTAANVAAQSQGLTDISDPNLTPRIFIIILFVMTIGIIWGIVFNILFMGQLDKFSSKAKSNPAIANFIPILSGAMFIALLITLSTPYVADFSQTSNLVAFIAAGLTTIVIEIISKRMDSNILKDFELPIAMIIGMAVVIVQTQLF